MHTADAPLAEAVDALRQGRTTPAEYLERCWGRMEAVEDEVAAFLPEAERRSRLEAAVASLPEEPAELPLYGVPVGVKDIFHVEGLPTRAGSELPPGALAGPPAAVWERLAGAGALALGKTVTTEFAYYAPGPTRNPHDTGHTPGGSSSGSAAAVAAGECPLALGTQTAGSVIRPAAFCGVVGFKPTLGRIPTDGVVPFSPTVDHVGLFAQDLDGTELAAAVCCDGWRTVPAPREPPAVGVPGDAYLGMADPAALEAFEAQLDRLAAAGITVERTDALAEPGELIDSHLTLIGAEMALAHRERGWYPEYADRYDPTTREFLEEGDAVTAGELGAARAARTARAARLGGLMADRGIDCWVTPAAPGPAPAGIDDTGDPKLNVPWTNVGFPAVTVPAGTVDGLPLGLQCVAAPGRDEDLLGRARQIEEALGTAD
jgi:Asp-tRNA(Asn)/Glu-tRNA(Gln) amidotransferase A subunit family amidase